jgi:glycosyltransferase involved in cell wall biosynthesis
MRFKWRFLSGGASWPAWLRGAQAALAMFGFLVTYHPRIVICGGYDSLAAWVCFLWAKVCRRRFVLWLESNGRTGRKSNVPKRCLKKLFVTLADAIAAAGTATTTYVTALGACAERVYWAPMSMDNDAFARTANVLSREMEGHKSHYPQRLLLYSGRLVEQKGVFVLLDAFARISKQDSDVGLLIAGDGPEREPMQALCRRQQLENVYFLGARKYQEMPYFYELADLLVLPTFHDAWGMVINEAFACGVPVVASEIAGACDDLILEGQTGFTVKARDAAALAERILVILKDPTLRSRMGAQCRWLIQQYSPEATARGLLAAATGQRT